jgi:hypothetical protein
LVTTVWMEGVVAYGEKEMDRSVWKNWERKVAEWFGGNRQPSGVARYFGNPVNTLYKTLMVYNDTDVAEVLADAARYWVGWNKDQVDHIVDNVNYGPISFALGNGTTHSDGSSIENASRSNTDSAWMMGQAFMALVNLIEMEEEYRTGFNVLDLKEALYQNMNYLYTWNYKHCRDTRRRL